MKFNHQRGFTLLLAALISSVVLALGASIFVLVRKQVTLSSLGRDSQFAFYTADQAAECALYWDARWNYIGTSSPPQFTLPNSDPTCDQQSWTPAGGTGRPGNPVVYPYMMVFQYEPISAGQSYCAQVTVEKCDGIIGAWDPASGASAYGSAPCTSNGSPIHTTVHADGYSTSCLTLYTNPRTLQRSVELHY
jgi:hypothetical protein